MSWSGLGLSSDNASSTSFLPVDSRCPPRASQRAEQADSPRFTVGENEFQGSELSIDCVRSFFIHVYDLPRGMARDALEREMF